MTVDGSHQDEVHEAAWEAEVERRWREIRSGAVETIPADVVFAEAEALLRA